MAAQGGDVQVVGEHVINISKSTKESAASVTEQIYYSNAGGVAYEGDLTFELVAEADLRGYSFTDANRTPLGNGGQVDSRPLPNETVGDLVRYTINLADKGVSFAPGRTYSLLVQYVLPGGLRDFARGFTLDTARVAVTIFDVPGLAPTSDETPFNYIANRWWWTLAPGEGGPFSAGERLAFTWTDVEVPLEPLAAEIRVGGGDDLSLTAFATGGIGPYTADWDLDGDGACDDHDGLSVSQAALRPHIEEPGAHRVKVCVTDSARPAGTREAHFETRTQEGTTTTAGPTGWALGAVGLIAGALIVFGLTSAGIMGTRGARGGGAAAASARPSFAAEGRDMLELRQRVMVAGLKELEIAKKKGEIEEGLYTPLKAELKQETVRVMRELEKRKGETI